MYLKKKSTHDDDAMLLEDIFLTLVLGLALKKTS